MRPVVERFRGPLQIVGSGEPDQAVSEILSLQQKKRHEDDDEPGRRERIDERLQHALDDLGRRHLGLVDFHRDGSILRDVRGRRPLQAMALVLADLLVDVAQKRRDSFQRAAARRIAHRANLLLNRELVFGQLLRQFRHLLADEQTDAQEDGAGERHDENHGRNARHSPASQHAHGRGQHKGQDDRQRQRQKNRSREIQRRDDSQDGQHGQRTGDRNFGAHPVGVRPSGPEKFGHFAPVRDPASPGAVSTMNINTLDREQFR